MEIINYLYPNEFFAQIIVIIQLLFFLVWVIFVLKSSYNLWQIQKDIKNCGNVGNLSQVIRQRYKQIDVSVTDTLISDDEANSTVESYFTVTGVSKKSPVHTHLKTLFFAGLRENSIDIPSLIANTNNRITKRNSSLRSLLSLFIILGLLGTLVGLASTLSGLSAGNEQLTSEILEQRVQDFLSRLGGAFAPSIWGVLLTIGGVIIYFSVYLRRLSLPVSELLERYTLSNWVPNLLPTPNQLQIERLQLSQKQLRANTEASEKILQAAPKIIEQVNEFEKNVTDAGNTFSALDSAASKLFDFAKSFNEGMQNLPNFQNDLKSISNSMLEDSAQLKTTVVKTLDGHKDFQTKIGEHFSGQNELFNKQYITQSEQITDILSTLKLYEETYVKDRKSIDVGIRETLSEAKRAFGEISKQNELMTKSFSDSIAIPLKESVVDKLGDLDGTLGNIATKLNQTNVPLQEAADKISSTFEHFHERTKILNKNLEESFTERINELREEIDKKDKQRDLQINSIEKLDKSILSLMNEFKTLGNKIEKTNKTSNNKIVKRPSRPIITEPKKSIWNRLSNILRRR